ncbi:MULTISPECIES: hypothetical protein [unclassified Roseofilum]|uniref:hypothetical protein n=1 Tax=unclassified Roseofilum TaxID=2620099 RepID=UPI000E8A766B|nr:MULTISPECIES: hypothetical protein [unclassified Roseofilum]HBQ97931.1 hypothetical protein [Cyanobacteria bacterium UBA11691]MBP0007571.1 hypothetical protein [Roseofilum sp. Belize Diploria]MBP0015438.1 hypothetical protein [Roseofilum sp. SID3]MBP0023849.1 hypothetical protein [Roseofilum sp. SID2]MBP0033947.1 hypothetical protein [Roseofilum sp. Belize BBD 4]
MTLGSKFSVYGVGGFLSVVLAQQTDADLMANVKTAFANFIESGQVWAFILGIILGYIIRQITTYGG